MRKLAYVAVVDSVSDIEGSDYLQVATTRGRGWRVVVSKGEFHVGDRCVMFEIDGYLNADDERFSFLRDRCLRKFVSKTGQVLKEGIRIKTVKLRGVLSQGVIIPISAFPEVSGLEEGADCTKILNVEHYDEIAEALRPATGCVSIPSDVRMSDFPSAVIPKTDEERIQNLGNLFSAGLEERLFEVTEKEDGTSVTMAYFPSYDNENPFAVCSRNMRLKPSSDKGVVPLPWKMARKYEVESRLAKITEITGREFALQGELVGPGINSNRDLYQDWEWRIFKVWDISSQQYLLPEGARYLVENELGLSYVPVIESECKVFSRFSSIDEILAFAEGKTLRGHEREGLVFKSTTNPYISFKAVSNRYLLKGNN